MPMSSPAATNLSLPLHKGGVICKANDSGIFLSHTYPAVNRSCGGLFNGPLVAAQPF